MLSRVSWLASVYALLLLPLTPAAEYTIWDYAPDFSKDPFPPYPSLQNPDGSNITLENLRGTRLFGWWGCTGERAKLIQEAYNDFYKLSNQLEVYNKIDWKGPAAQDFFAVDDDAKNQHIPQNTRDEILRELFPTYA
jgi:hypothetical protein